MALEPEFWAVLSEAADHRGITLATLIAEIDASRLNEFPDRPLASACRVFALRAAQRDQDGPA